MPVRIEASKSSDSRQPIPLVQDTDPSPYPRADLGLKKMMEGWMREGFAAAGRSGRPSARRQTELGEWGSFALCLRTHAPFLPPALA